MKESDKNMHSLMTVALIDEAELSDDPLDAMYLLMQILSDNQKVICKCIKLKDEIDTNDDGC